MRPDRLIVGEIRLPKEPSTRSRRSTPGTTGRRRRSTRARPRTPCSGSSSSRASRCATTLVDLRSYIERVFDLVVVLRRLRTGRRIVRQIVALDGLTPDGAYRLADVFHAGRHDGPDDLGWVADPAWRPSARLAARMELEG